jgi:EcsC protein family
MPSPSEYERRAILQIHAWKNPTRTWLDTVSDVASWPLDKAGKAVMRIPGFGDVVQKATTGIVGVLNDGAQYTVRVESILDDYKMLNGGVSPTLEQVGNLDLQIVDRTIGWLDTKYEGLALVEGAAAGGAAVLHPVVALAAIPADLAALLTMNLRAIGEYATYCGFDISHQEERLFALNVLAYSSSTTDASKQAALAQLVRIARDVATKATWKKLEESAFVQAVQQIAKALSIRLTKAKLGNTIPVAGAVIGGGYNAYFTDKVCKAAFYLYRERFLARRYGPEVVEITVPPADTLTPDFEDADIIDPPSGG